MSYRIINGKAYSVGSFDYVEKVNKNFNTKCIEYKPSFKEVLENTKCKKQDFIISKHAALRLNDINLTQDDINKIQSGFKIAEDKNSKNTVMIYKDMAIIASVENKTLITVIEKERSKDSIFTNVDSVVIL